MAHKSSAMSKEGRPTKYTDKTLEIANDYVANHSSYGDVVPSIAGLSCELSVCKNTIYAWSKDKNNSEFLRTLGVMKSKQERLLLSGGLTSELNSQIVKLMLWNHGWCDKKEDEQESGENITNIVFNVDESVKDVKVTRGIKAK